MNHELRKCPHGIEVGPLDDYEVPDTVEVKSVYCNQCHPRIVKNDDGSYTNSIEFQYLTDDEKRKVLVEK